MVYTILVYRLAIFLFVCQCDPATTFKEYMRARNVNQPGLMCVLRRSVLIAVLALSGNLLLLTAGRTEVVDIDNVVLHQLLEEGVPIIDVRRAEEWPQTGIIKGSILITFFDKVGNYDAEQWLAQVEEKVNTDKPFILICHSGGRTSMISKWLGKNLSKVYNVDRGIVHWIVDKRETVAP